MRDASDRPPSTEAPSVPRNLVCYGARDDGSNLLGKKRWYGVSYLMVLLCPVSAKEVVIWESLKSCGLAYRQASALRGIEVNVIVSVLRNMRRYGGRRPS